MLDLRAHFNRFREQVRRLMESPSGELSRWGRLAVYQIRLWRYCGRQLRRDRLLTVAGDLTYKTLLSIIPLLVIFMLVVSLVAGGTDFGSRALQYVFDILNISEIRMKEGGVDLPSQINQIVAEARQRVSAAAIIGFIFLFFVATNALGTLEAATNRIWQVSEKRSFWRRWAMFWLILTVGPLAVAVALYLGTALEGRALASGVPTYLTGLGEWAVTLLGVWFVLYLVYTLLPNAEVRFRAAMTGAIVAGTVWHVLGRYAFQIYMQYAIGPHNIYGNLSVVPVFFMWIYVTWIIVLFGCELAYVVQNMRDLARAEADQQARRESRFLPAEFAALVVALAATKRFLSGNGPTPLTTFVDAAGVARPHVREIVSRLEDAQVLVRTAPRGHEDEPAWTLARDPSTVQVADVLQAAAGQLPTPADPDLMPLHRRAKEVYDRLAACRRQTEGDETLAGIAGNLQP